MAVRLDAAQQVKKSPSRPRGDRNEKAATTFGASFSAWLLRPTPRWGFAAAAALIALFGAWQWYRNLDPTPKRWSWEKETSSACFNTLTTPTATSKDLCFHSEDEKIAARFWDWTRPSVAVYSTASPPQASPTLRDLGDQGQAEAIRFLEKDPTQKGAWANLQEALDDAKSTVGEHDPFRFERVLIANVEQGVDWAPGDRMVWTRVLVEPINFAFAGYSVAQTDNQIQKVSSVERTDSRKFSADLSATIPGMEGPKAGLSPSSEQSVKTDTEINAQYEKLGVDILPGFLRIMRQSETGGDAVGNTKVSLTAVTDPKTIWKRYPKDRGQRQSDDDPIVLLVTGTHFDGDGDHIAGDKSVSAVDILPEVRAPHCALRARVWMLYEERHIDSGRDSYDESKQNVTMVRDAEDKQDVDVVSADEVSPAVWSLKLCENSQCTGDDGHVLRAAVQPALPGPQNALLWRKVVFTDYAVAFRLAHWLKTHQTGTPPNTGYRFNYPDANETAVSLMPIKTDKDECQAQQGDEVSRR